MAEGLERLPERADRARDERAHTHDLACPARHLHPLARDQPHLVGQLVGREAHFVAAEGVGLDQLGAGRQVVAVHRFDDRGAGQVEPVEALVEGDAALVELRPHRPVGEQGTAGEAVEECGWHGPRNVNGGQRTIKEPRGQRTMRDRPYFVQSGACAGECRCYSARR